MPAEDRLTLLEAELRSRDERLKRVEDQLHELGRNRKDFWDKLHSVSPLVSGTVVVVVGFLLTGSVNVALQKRQLDLSTVKGMQESLAKMREPNATPGQTEAAAVALAAFGSHAVTSLISELQFGGTNRRNAAETGLRAVGLSDPKVVCGKLLTIVTNPSRLFNWHVHKSAIGILGDLNCEGAATTLREYLDLVERSKKDPQIREYKGWVNPKPAPTLKSIDLVEKELIKALEILEEQETGIR